MRKNILHYLLAGILLLMFTACGGGSATGGATDEQKALDRIANYVHNGGEAPEVSDYQTLHITGVTEENVDIVNQLIDDLDTIAVTDIQAAVTALEVFRAYAASNGANGHPPSQADYEVLGITGVTDANRDAINNLIAGKTADQVDSQGEIQGVVDGYIPADITKPTITLIGDATVTLRVGDAYTDAGATASDNKDGNITANIIITNPTDTSILGTYTITYDVNDSAGNQALQVTRRVNVVSLPPKGYADLGDYTPKLYTNNKSGNNRYIAYYPENAISADMPVVMFIKGGGSATIESYRGIMQFMASKGYYVIGVDTNSYASRYVTQKLEIALNEVKERHGLTVSKLAIMGHSLGGGQAFYAMKKFRDDGYGNEGNLALSIDGWFAFNMDQIDLNLLDTKVSFLQMNGVNGTGTDPRIDLKIWNLATQSQKAFYTLPSTNHSYVAGDLENVLAKEDLVFTIGALTDDAFKGVNDGATAIPETNKATYSDIVNALKLEDTYHGGDCKGIQYNAVSVIKNNDINYCDFEASYPPEANLTEIVVDTVARPLEKFSSYLDVTFDNTVERNVTRVTNREQDNKGFNGHQYPKQGSAWNSDMSLFRLVGRVYDAETLKEIPLTKTKTSGEVYSLMKAPESGSSGIRWSKFDPNILYVMSAGKKFYKLTISPDKTTISEEVIIDLSASERPFFNIGQNEGNIDYEDKYVVLTSLDGNDTYAALLDIKAKNLVWGVKKLTFAKSDFDWMSISPSGNYILISADSIIRLYNRNLDFIRVLANRAEHGDIGYDQNGNEMYVQFHSGGVGIFGFVLNDSPDYVEPIKLLDSNYGGGHISCRNYKRKGWCYVSTREDGYREVYALKLDGSKIVQRFAKTNARGPEDPRIGDDTHYYYATYPTAVPSPYGSRVLFWSDYGNAEGFLYYYKGNDDKWHTTNHYDNRDTYQVRISK